MSVKFRKVARCFISFEVFSCGTWYLYEPETRARQKGFPTQNFKSKEKHPQIRTGEGSRWLALCVVGAGARARVPGTLLRAPCVRKGCMHRHDDDVFYLFLQKQNLGAKLHIYL
jgi:hypothetical protein